MDTHNFEWPGKVQQMVYRIYWYNSSSHVKNQDQFKVIVQKWAAKLFETYHYYNVEFFRETNAINIVLHISRYVSNPFVIHVDMNKDKFECCTISYLGSEFIDKDINIFNIKYLEYSKSD